MRAFIQDEEGNDICEMDMPLEFAFKPLGMEMFLGGETYVTIAKGGNMAGTEGGYLTFRVKLK